MRTVYITKDGGTVRRQGATLQVHVGQEPPTRISAIDLHQLVLMGNITLTPAALDLLIERGVDTVFLTHYGRFRGRLVHGTSGHIRLRLAQFQLLTQPDRAIDLARRIVQGKLTNQRTLLKRYARRHGQTPELKQAAIALRAAAHRVTIAGNLDEIRGVEGSGAAAYFRHFGHLIRRPGFTFSGRNRRPPMDPINALLSLGYTLLFNAVHAAVEIVGLDPYLGALHAPETNRPSLVCDLMEEYRPGLVDAPVIGALNKGVLTPDDFEDQGEGQPVHIKRDAVRTFVRVIEQRLLTSVHYPEANGQLTWRQIIERQARQCARHMHDEAPYTPFPIT